MLADLERIHALLKQAKAGGTSPAVDVDELQHFWHTGWAQATEQAARDKELELTDYAPADKVAPLFLRCSILQRLSDDDLKLTQNVFEAVAKAPFGKDLNYSQFVKSLKSDSWWGTSVRVQLAPSPVPHDIPRGTIE